MLNLPKINPLANQAAELLRDSILSGEWCSKLPPERILCKQYNISRNTLRNALEKLQEEKLICTTRGSGTRILACNNSPLAPSHDVGLLVPEPLERLRPTHTLWVNELRGLLSERGYQLRTFYGREYFSPAPGAALQRLVEQNSMGCWILTLSNPAMQRWFAEKRVRCVVAGSVHEGLKLPSRDIDHRAMSRHAAGVFLRLGHRRLALLAAQSFHAGDIEGEIGFIEGVKPSTQEEADALLSYHDGTVAGIAESLRRLMEQRLPPTAILVGNSYHYLTVVGCLGQLGLRVPQDVSLISREDDLFLSYVTPRPARYRVNLSVFAKSLLSPILDLLENRAPIRPEQRFMPEFMTGETLARLSVSADSATPSALALSA
ncbi:MAG: substrate-binding domain-containing protein [Opitutae bacterium]|nr:substrate-binding domain-containing protein [Opitutae bacterium]